MALELAYIRAKTSKIQIKEVYRFHNEVSRNPEDKENGLPSGQLLIEVPYDGEEYFSRRAYQDFRRQAQQYGSLAFDTNGRVGYLLFKDHSRTDLDSCFNLLTNYNTTPVDIPLRNGSLASNEDLLRDIYKAVIKRNYTPNSLEIHPVRMTVSVFDEDTISNLFRADAASNDGEGTLTDQVARELRLERGFRQELVFFFDIRVALPLYAGELLNSRGATPRLRSFSLEWPFPTSQTQMALHATPEPEQKMIYDPYLGGLTWGGIPFNRGEKPDGMQAYYFRLPPLVLEVQQPGALYHKDLLQGQMCIDLPLLLSGTQVEFYNAQGMKDKTPISTASELVIDFDLYPEDCFSDKIYAPYQHIQFEGLILEEMRHTDIRKALQDRGFTIEKEETHRDKSDSTALRSSTIIASRPEGPHQIKLWLQTEGTVSTTERVRERYSSESFKTEVRTGHTVIYIRGELQGSGTRLTQILNEIQVLLKERLSRHIKLD